MNRLHRTAPVILSEDALPAVHAILVGVVICFYACCQTEATNQTGRPGTHGGSAQGHSQGSACLTSPPSLPPATVSTPPPLSSFTATPWRQPLTPAAGVGTIALSLPVFTLDPTGHSHSSHTHDPLNRQVTDLSTHAPAFKLYSGFPSIMEIKSIITFRVSGATWNLVPTSSLVSAATTFLPPPICSGLFSFQFPEHAQLLPT